MKILYATLVLLALCACSSVEKSEGVSQLEENATNSVSVGNSFKIVLNSNPTTGYSWELIKPDTDVLSFNGSEFIAPKTSLAGAGGKQEFYFRAERVGAQTLTFEYRRPWEERRLKPIQTKIFTVDVSSAQD